MSPEIFFALFLTVFSFFFGFIYGLLYLTPVRSIALAMTIVYLVSLFLLVATDIPFFTPLGFFQCLFFISVGILGGGLLEYYLAYRLPPPRLSSV